MIHKWQAMNHLRFSLITAQLAVINILYAMIKTMINVHFAMVIAMVSMLFAMIVNNPICHD